MALTESYEKKIIMIMADEKCTFSEALMMDFEDNLLDTSSVIGLVDYLEEQVETLDQVEYIMNIFVGNVPDLELKVLEDEKKV